MLEKQPIAIFDSGIGGLTVAKAIHEKLPNENLIYFGDTAHFPYGDKEPASILNYAEKITDFLVSKNCKAIIIACNTASAIAYGALKIKLDGKIPVFDVISPVAKYFQNSSFKKIGVIATKGTIGSQVYPLSIIKLNKGIEVRGLATPLLAPMIEEGFFNDSISETVINEYLSNTVLEGIQAIVLGCTHYPIIQQEIESYYSGKNVELVNSAHLIAMTVHEYLKNKNALSKTTATPTMQFFVSDYTSSFEKSTKIFFGDLVHLEKLDLWQM